MTDTRFTHTDKDETQQETPAREGRDLAGITCRSGNCFRGHPHEHGPYQCESGCECIRGARA